MNFLDRLVESYTQYRSLACLAMKSQFGRNTKVSILVFLGCDFSLGKTKVDLPNVGFMILSLNIRLCFGLYVLVILQSRKLWFLPFREVLFLYLNGICSSNFGLLSMK